MLNNEFTEQFADHIKFVYSFFDRLIIRGYILGMFAWMKLKTIIGTDTGAGACFLFAFSIIPCTYYPKYRYN
jgi:hypothetical protein